jgi:hypothetical protein
MIFRKSTKKRKLERTIKSGVQFLDIQDREGIVPGAERECGSMTLSRMENRRIQRKGIGF